MSATVFLIPCWRVDREILPSSVSRSRFAPSSCANRSSNITRKSGDRFASTKRTGTSLSPAQPGTDQNGQPPCTSRLNPPCDQKANAVPEIGPGLEMNARRLCNLRDLPVFSPGFRRLDALQVRNAGLAARPAHLVRAVRLECIERRIERLEPCAVSRAWWVSGARNRRIGRISGSRVPRTGGPVHPVYQERP